MNSFEKYILFYSSCIVSSNNEKTDFQYSCFFKFERLWKKDKIIEK